ncbi:MAG TPA: acryloyl-CoA reductase, partial [Acidimicrobiales bacterium]|nr:acryloyl-CoA reductase [Acidimicrobiales bacterium]
MPDISQVPEISEMPEGPEGRFPAYVVRRRDDGIDHGPEDLDGDDFRDLPPGDVLIRVEWSSVNYKDAMVTQPGNRVARISPLVPGVDLAGVVVSSPGGDPAPGTPVLAHGHDLGVSRHGGFARFARVPSDWVVALPAGMSTREAMIIGTAGFTAALSVDQLEHHGLRPGDGPVLVTGASGGVGSFAVNLLGGRGYEVVASSGKEAERPWLEAIGATRVIGRAELDTEPGRTLGPELWAGAVDCVGGATLAQIIRTLRYGAAVAASGLTAGTALETTVFPFITRGVALLGVDSVSTPTERRRRIWARLADDLRPTDIEALVAREVDLHGVATALDDILAAR